ncbi:Hypothetical_protein [Hexamita inflata]|uniref:Hypothetical_protein n=1 Tax=Hexamita inflata TaxID=28002 RepID=A0AA86R7L3_9EUKA|nr:Hypothetical protein HINF_LOCUS55237 [Hexamita inflata]
MSWNGSRESEQEFMQAMTGMALLSEAQAQLMQIYENQLLYNCKQTTTISNKTIQPPKIVILLFFRFSVVLMILHCSSLSKHLVLVNYSSKFNLTRSCQVLPPKSSIVGGHFEPVQFIHYYSF